MRDAERVQCVFSDDLAAETRRTLFDWDADPFHSKVWGLTWRPKPYHLTLYRDGEPISHVGFVRETVAIGGGQVAVGGFGDVITVPDARGKGFAQKALREAIHVLRTNWGLRHGMLFCFPPLLGFYEKLGWCKRAEPIWISQPAGKIAFPACTMVQAWDDAVWPAGEIGVDGLPW